MKLNGKQRKLSNSVKWRLDCDYLDKLPPPEREYLEQFLSEYYLGNTAIFSECLHTDKLRGKLRATRSHAENDIVTADARSIEKSARSAADGNLRKRGRYSPADYQSAELNPEDALVEALDE